MKLSIIAALGGVVFATISTVLPGAIHALTGGRIEVYDVHRYFLIAVVTELFLLLLAYQFGYAIGYVNGRKEKSSA